ncbi:MAG: SHOCT domain-containing protein [Streptosporangiaceae bacterium]
MCGDCHVQTTASADARGGGRGGAYVAGKKVAQRSAEQGQLEDEQNERIGDLEQQQAPPEPDQQAPEPSMIDQLNQLTALHEQGALTDDEFSSAKAKLLG